MKNKVKLFQKEFSLKFPLSAIDRKTILLLSGFMLLLTCTITGCGSNSPQQPILPVAEPIPTENPAQEEPAKAAQSQSVSDASSSSPSYWGTWQITSSTFGAYSAMSEEDCSALMGTRFEYFNDYAIYDNQHRLDSPQYIESILTADDFSSIYQGTSLETLGISKDSIQVVAIENAGGIGDTFYIKDENTLIIPWDGVFFEVQRISFGN